MQIIRAGLLYLAEAALNGITEEVTIQQMKTTAEIVLTAEEIINRELACSADKIAASSELTPLDILS